MMKKFLWLVVFVFLHINCIGETDKNLDNEIQRIMKKYQGIGLSIAVVKDCKISQTITFGYNPDYSDTTLRNPIPDDGIYVIASISKTFVSTAIMQLVEDKKLQLDDDINSYLSFNVRNPKFPDVPITVRMLLCHRSSLNDSQYAWNLQQIDPKTGKKWKDCYNDYAPGEGYKYCNLGYSLLGAIIENVTGERFYEYVENHITKPIGINASYNLVEMDSTKLVKALNYDSTQKRFKLDGAIYNYSYFQGKLKDYKLGYTVASFSPTGGMKITANDLATYMIMHMNNGEYKGKKIISKDSELEMRKPQMGNPIYGLAFSHYKGRVKDVVLDGMVGCAHGIHSSMLFNPKEKYGFVVICNGCTSGGSDGQKLNTEIIQVLYKHLIK